MLSVDINCDMGEGMNNDELVLPFISSASIACGFHAGNEASMKQAIELALKNGVAIGAHPGFPDKANFGQTVMNFSAGEIYNLIADQVNALIVLCKQLGATLNHVKPHGALYNIAAKQPDTAHAIACAVYDIDKHLVLYGLAGSTLISEGKNTGLRTASEVFANRRYNDDGSLVPATDGNAIITKPEEAVAQMLQMLQHKTVTTISGKSINIKADTVCIDSQAQHAVEFAREINFRLKEQNIAISSIQKNTK